MRPGIFLAIAGLLLAPALFGQTTLYWDTNGKNTAGAGGPSPSGTWSTAGADKNWTTNSGGTTAGPQTWTSGAIAVFSAGTDATGSYTVTVSGTQTTAGITVEDGSPILSGGTVSFTGTSPTVSVAAGSTATFNSLISSTTGLTTTGAGATILANSANAYTGATTISGGTLQLGANNSIASGSAVSVASGATFDVNGKTNTVGSLAGAGNISLGAGALTAGGDNSSTTVSGVISGTAASSLTKTGNGALTLGGANTFAGSLAVSAGTVLANAANVFNSANTITVNTGSILNLNDFNQTIASITSNGTLALGAGTGDTLTLSSGASTLAGSITGAGTIIIGSGATLTLSANFSAPDVNIVLAGGSLLLNGTTDTFGTLTFSANSILDFGSGAASVLTANNVVVYSGIAVTINNWIDTQDYFYATNNFQVFNPGTGSFTNAVVGQHGVAPGNQFTFNNFSAANTSWTSDHQITPAPEPATYGAILIGATLAFFLWRRRNNCATVRS